MSPARGKGQRPPGPATEPLPAVSVAPAFKAVHTCRTLPATAHVWNVPPRGWELRLGREHVAVTFCPFCQLELEVQT